MTNCVKLFLSKRILLILTIFVFLVGFIISSRGTMARPQEDGTLVLSVEDKDFGVSYKIGVDNLNNEVNGMIEYDQSSVVGIEKYREFNYRILAKILQNANTIDSVPAKITFNTPIDQAELAEFVNRYEIDVKTYVIYMLEPDGKIATIQGGPSEAELVPEASFNIATTSISQEYNSDAEFLGWVEVDGMVQTNRISELKADQHVYLIDVMQLFLESKLTDEALADAGVAEGVRRELLQFGFTEIYRAPVAWGLYRLGLMQTDSSQ